MPYTFNPFTSNLDDLGSGSNTTWKDSVADVPSLPASGNTQGDVRVVRATWDAYVWTASAWTFLGPVKASAFGSTPNANGFSVASDNTITLQPADGTHPGGVSTSSQTFAGAKTFSSTITGNISGNAGSATTVRTADNNDNASYSPVFASDFTGNNDLLVTSTISFVPLTGVGTFGGLNVTGLTASEVVVTDGSKNLASYAYSIGPAGTTFAVRDSQGNSVFNNSVSASSTTVSSGQIIAVSSASTRIQKITGTSTVTFNLPDATSLTLSGWCYEFDNNSTGTITINKHDGTTLVVNVPGGGYAYLVCTDNSTSNGTWDSHFLVPQNSSWGTTALTIGGTVSASNLSGTNTGDLTLASFGSTPSANGASLSSQVLTLQPADGTHPGGVSTTTQTFAGNKTFTGSVYVNNASSSYPLGVAATGTSTPIMEMLGPSGATFPHWTWNITNDGNSQLSLDNPHTSTVAATFHAHGEVGFGRAATGSGAKVQVQGQANEANLWLINNASTPGDQITGYASNASTVLWNVDNAGKGNFANINDAGLSASYTVVTDASKNLISGLAVSAGDIGETSFSAANNQSIAANVTGLTFANATVRSFDALVSVYVNATSSLYEVFTLRGIQKGSSWDMTSTSNGDASGFVFSITTAGQVQYTNSNYAGFTAATVKFRAITTSV